MARGIRLFAFLALLAAALPAAAQDPLRPGETARDSDAVFPGSAADEAGIWAVRIVDAVTRRPIPGATVRVPNHRESGATPQDVFDLVSATADEDGWARLPLAKMEGWKDYVVADAPGYAANEHCTPERSECALDRGTDVPFVLLDVTGRPVAGARVALNLCCGHVADQREAVTDAKGLGVLKSIDPARHGDVWIDGPGLHRGTTALAGTWRTGDPPVAVHAAPGIVVEGRVLAADGKPVKGAALGAHGLDRPWTRTDADGRFRLPGVDAWSTIDVHVTDDREKLDASFIAPREGVRRTLTLEKPAPTSAAVVRVRGRDGEPAADVRVALVRTADGRTETAPTDPEGIAKFAVPAGSYDVLADGELGVWGSGESTLEVVPGEDAAASVTVPRNPTVRVDASRLEGLKLVLATARRTRKLVPAEIDGKDVPFPSEGLATFRISGTENGETLVRFIDVPTGAARAQPLVLDWLPETRVSAQLTGPDGKPAPGRLRIVRQRGRLEFGKPPAPEPSATPTAVTRLTGTADWIAEPEDRALGAVTGTIALPAPGGRVDVGAVRFGPSVRPALQVHVPHEFSDGQMVRYALHRVNFKGMSMIGEDGLLGQDLAWAGKDEQVTVEVQDRSVLPLVVRADRPPPWIAHWPTASLTIHALDADLSALVPSLVVDGRLVDAEADETGGVTAHGLAAGPHDVVVSVSGHRAKVLRLVIEDGEKRDLDVALQRRK